jgi:predicted nucleotidyltransferase
MFFYSIDASNPSVIEFKKLVNLLLLEPLVEGLQKIANRIVLYGSCAQGTDTSQSDFDLFVVTNNKEYAANIISGFRLPKGFENLRIQPVIKTPIELLQAAESEKAVIEEVERGIILWKKAANEQDFKQYLENKKIILFERGKVLVKKEFSTGESDP